MRPALRRVTVGRSRPTFIHHSSLTVATTVAMEREMQAKMDKWACSLVRGRGPVKPHDSGRGYGYKTLPLVKNGSSRPCHVTT